MCFEFDALPPLSGVPHEIRMHPGAAHSFFDRAFEEHAGAWRRVLDLPGKAGTDALA